MSKCKTCGFNVKSDDPNEHGIGFSCSMTTLLKLTKENERWLTSTF